MTDESSPDPIPGFDPPVWHAILGTSGDAEPTGRYVYAAEKLIADAVLRERLLMAMREVRNRCGERDGRAVYRSARREDLPADYLDRVRAHLPGLDGLIRLASVKELVPAHDWLTEEQHQAVFADYVAVARGLRFPLVPYHPIGKLFGGRPFKHITQFDVPARDVLGLTLGHKPVVSELSGILAFAADAAAQGDPESARHAVSYLLDAAKTPPLVIRQMDRTNLVLLCAD